MAGFKRRTLLAAAVGLTVVVAACGGGGSQSGEQLATDQTLRFPIQDDVETLDSGHSSSAVDITFLANLYSGLVRFDDHLKVVPDIAESLPTVSADGLTWTFKLRKNVKFSNGDPVTTKDVIYSWTRTARLNDAYASVFDPLQGVGDVEKGKAKEISGLKAQDDYTLVATLTQPAGYWLSELALPTASMIVNQKAIEANGEDKWWQTPQGLIGSGPFKMTQRSAKASMDFEAVPNWWGGSTGAIKKVHVDIVTDLSSAVQKYEAGGYDLVGMANQPLGAPDALRFKNNPTKAKELSLFTAARTTWIGFNELKGPFKGVQDGKEGRRAFSLAVNRDQMVDVACAKGLLCVKATGGVIAKGLKGYLGDNADPNAKFDPTAAKAALEKWDPSGTKRKGLQYRFNATPFNTAVAENLQSQWRQNLGVTVDIVPSDFPTLLRQRKAKETILFRDSWSADYDHPQDWFDNLFVCAQAPPGKNNYAAYCNQQVDQMVSQADQVSLDKAVPDYIKAQRQMIDDVVFGALFYSVQSYVAKPYVRGYGYNGLYDFSWTSTKLLQH
jgi:ABC-type oligopeptide transport system substrate-binding subunit